MEDGININENLVTESVPAAAAAAADTTPIQPVTVFELPASVGRNRKELAMECYQHSDETYKKGTRLSFFVVFCGLFAVGCLAVAAYNVHLYGIDWVFALMMAGYVIVAAFCFIPPLYYIYATTVWKMGFGGLLRAEKTKKPVKFDDQSLTISGKQERIIYYESMWDAYETEDYFVFHCSEGCIVPVDKVIIADKEQELTNTDLMTFFSDMVAKVNGTAPEEPVPNITR